MDAKIKFIAARLTTFPLNLPKPEFWKDLAKALISKKTLLILAFLGCFQPASAFSWASFFRNSKPQIAAAVKATSIIVYRNLTEQKPVNTKSLEMKLAERRQKIVYNSWFDITKWFNKPTTPKTQSIDLENLSPIQRKFIQRKLGTNDPVDAYNKEFYARPNNNALIAQDFEKYTQLAIKKSLASYKLEKKLEKKKE